MYKSLRFSETPFSYATFRMWFSDGVFYKIFAENQGYRMLQEQYMNKT